jgi:hypothetical protein
MAVQAAEEPHDSAAGADLQQQPAAPAATNILAGGAEDQLAVQAAGEPQDSAAAAESLQRLMEQLSLCSQPQGLCSILGLSDQQELESLPLAPSG